MPTKNRMLLDLAFMLSPADATAERWRSMNPCSVRYVLFLTEVSPRIGVYPLAGRLALIIPGLEE
jgi:hypothetical protein